MDFFFMKNIFILWIKLTKTDTILFDAISQ